MRRLAATLVAVLATAAPAAAAKPLTIGLAAGTVNRVPALGQPLGPALVALAPLGRPGARIRVSPSSFALRYGPPKTYRALALFRPVNGRLVLAALVVADASARDPRAGPVLSAAARIASVYAVLRPANCTPACPQRFFRTDDGLTVSFGSDAGRPYVRIQLGRAAA